jgi:hypothetical protein
MRVCYLHPPLQNVAVVFPLVIRMPANMACILLQTSHSLNPNTTHSPLISGLRLASSANPCNAFLPLANPMPIAELSTTCAPPSWLPLLTWSPLLNPNESLENQYPSPKFEIQIFAIRNPIVPFCFFRNNSIQISASRFECQLTLRGENGSKSLVLSG